MAETKLNEEQKTLVRELILWLERKYSRWSRETASTLNDRVNERFTRATVDELQSLYSKPEADVSRIHKYLFLAPLGADSSVLPVASISCNFRKKVPEVRAQVALFALGDNKLKAIGLRFETPESQGPHNYYHCQFITGYRTSGDDVPLPVEGWMPTKDPTFMLGAKNAVALMVCLIASLYGRTEVDNLAFEKFGSQLKRYIKLLPWEESKTMGTAHQQDEDGRWHCSV
jgi:hypothetical protein